MREICTSGSMRGEAATMVTLVPPLLLYWLDFSAASLGVKIEPAPDQWTGSSTWTSSFKSGRST